MICPNCGFDMNEEKTCEKCGFIAEDEQIKEEETAVDFDALEKIEVDFGEVENSEEIEEDENLSDEKDLEVDFDTIEQNVVENKTKKSGSWGVSIISFIAGVLSTLIVIGCLNGTIVSYFDKITNGTPYEAVESFSEFYFENKCDLKNKVKVLSPYFRSQFIGMLEYYGFGSEVNLDIDTTNDAELLKVLESYQDMINESTDQIKEVTSVEFKDYEYIKSGTQEFNDYIDEYKKVDPAAKGVSLFANVNFTVKYDVTTVEEQTTTVPETTKKKKKGNKETTTTPTVTQAPKTKTESVVKECTAVCVKINDEWKVFNGLQVLS